MKKLPFVVFGFSIILFLVFFAGGALAANKPTISFPACSSTAVNCLKVYLPLILKENEATYVSAESTAPRNLNGITRYEYTWNFDVCGTKKTYVKNYPADPQAYKADTQVVKYTNGCPMTITVKTKLFSGNTPSGEYNGNVNNAPLKKQNQYIQLAGPNKVKANETAWYTGTFVNPAASSEYTYKPFFYESYRCGVLHQAEPATNGQVGFTFSWTPTRIMKCKINAWALYLKRLGTQKVTEVMYANKTIDVNY